MWLNGSAEATTLDINYTEREQNNRTYTSGQVMDVAHNNQSIIAVGSRSNATTQVATVWNAGKLGGKTEVLVYGGDIYVMTVEHNHDTGTHCTRIWMNHQLKGTVAGIVGNAMVVI